MIPSTGYPYWMFGALAMQSGQTLMNSAGDKTNFTAPGTVKALEFWRSLGATHKVMPDGVIEWGTLRKNFLEGRTAMMWHSTGNLTTVKKKAKFDFGVAMLPAGERRGTPTGGGNFYIFKWSVKTGYMGISADSYKTDMLKKYVAEFPPAAVARDQLEFATAELSTFQAGRIRKSLDDAIQATLTGKKSAKDALAGAQSEADRLLKNYR